MKYFIREFRVRIGTFLGRGGTVIESGSAGLNPKAVAGGPSVTTIKYNISCVEDGPINL
jgi:hypothetical protein